MLTATCSMLEMMIKDIDERFWRKVKFEDSVFPENGCILWTGGQDGRGYARFCTDAVHQRAAHRWVYERYRGPVPNGMELDHLCRVRHCVNPDHLEPVPHKVNLARSDITVQARLSARTHCINGHEFTPENTFFKRKVRGRRCRICKRLSERNRQHARKTQGNNPR
jgi:hypothetical protein